MKSNYITKVGMVRCSLDEDTVVTTSSNGDARSYLYDEYWDFSSNKDIPIHNSTKISFAYIINIKSRKKIQETVFSIYSSNKSISVANLIGVVTALRVISKVLGHTDWNKLSGDLEWRKLKAGLKNRYTGGTLEHYHATLRKLVTLNYFDRVIGENELRLLAKESQSQQHIAIPTSFYQKILQHSIESLEKYHPYRHEISETMGRAYHIKKKAEKNCQLTPRQKRCKNIKKSITEASSRQSRKDLQHNIPDFMLDFTGSWIKNILTECIIVCALFSGARIGEILSFNKDSYVIKKTINGDVSTIQGGTSKGNDGVVRSEIWQCHPIVKDALELAYDMTSFARDIYKDQIEALLGTGTISEDEYERGFATLDSSFITARVTKKCNLSYVLPAISVKTNELLQKLQLKASIDDIREFDLLNDTRLNQLKLGGTLPKLSPHDFRRSFAVFMRRHGLGNAQTIKFQYKHKNIQMSEYYANNAHLAQMHDILLDEDLLQFMEEEGIRIGVDTYDEIFNKSEKLSGVEGKRILKDKFESMKSGQNIYMSRKEIEVLLRNGTISLVMLPTGGYCTNSNCERICSFQEFSAEKNICQYKIITDKEAKKQGKYRERLICKFDLLNQGDETMNNILSGIKQSIISIESTLTTHDIPYKAFTSKIGGCYDS